MALIAEALELQPGDRVLEVGAGSGYAAAILGRVAASSCATWVRKDAAMSRFCRIITLDLSRP